MATNERSPRLAEVITYALDLFRAGLYVGRPVRVDSVNNAKCTVDVVPMLQDSYTDDEDVVQPYALPIIPAIPILFAEGNDFVDTFPIKKGDQGWILFADRSIDQWQQLGNAGDPVDPKTELRHALPAKGLFLPGGRSVKEAFTEWDPDRRVIGAKGGPRIAFTSEKIHFGVSHQEDADDALALAKLVKQEVDKLKTKHNTLVDAFDNHFHQLNTSGPPLVHTGVSETPLPSEATADDVQDMGSTILLAKGNS